MEAVVNNHISSFFIDDKYRLYRHLVLWVVIFTITLSVFFDAPDQWNTSLNRFYGWISYFLFLNMLVYFNAYVLFPRFLAKNKLLAYLVSVTLFTVFALFVMVILQELFYDIAVTRQQPSGIAIFLSIASSMLTILLFLGGISALLLFKDRMISNRRINDLRLATFQSEINILKSQINPHFLFNMINNANIMVDEDPKTASHILVKLDDMLQYQLKDSTQDKVSLNADIAFLTDFLDLEKVRRDHFEYTLSVGDDFEDIQIPPLLFIPFVENAVKHNLDTNMSYLHIRFKAENRQLHFECKNSKPTKPVKRQNGGLGLTNIKRRLDLIFGDNYVLDVTETDTTYTVNLQLSL